MVNRPRGTRDFDPAQMAQRRGAEQALRQVFQTFGFQEVQTPVFEELELFTAKSGDGIISELYNFQDKGERDMTLRPELTAPVMRMYFQDHAFDPKPIKWCYFGACYRYDRPQEGRYREFWQFGCEQIGAGTPLAYAELIALGAGCFDALGLKDIEIRVGHVAILRAAVDTFGFDEETRGAFMRAIDKEDRETMQQIATDKGGCEAALDRLLLVMDAPDVAAARLAMGDEAADAFDDLRQTLELLAAFGVDVTLNLGIARGLDYYTGVVFEAHCKELEAQSQLLGGGGYDLSALFGGQPTPTMGFGLGFDRALVALEKQGRALTSTPRPVAYLGALSDAAQTAVVPIAARLRRSGVAVELDIARRKPNKVAAHADHLGATYLVLVGDRDLEAGTVQVKHLADGARTEVAIGDVADWLLEQSGNVDLRDYN